MTNLPQEATGATALSARWNAILDKLQNASDTDVRIRGRKLSAGTVVATTGSFSNISGSGYSIMQDEGVALTSRSTVDFVGTGVTVSDTGSKTQVSIPSGCAAAYYGVKAEDYITSGDGSVANPYNASAIQSAINALSTRGGIVFIKEGVWRGTTRISVNATGSERNKKVVFQGAGSPKWQIYFHDTNPDTSRSGTHVQAGFDIYVPCDFYDMEISPHPDNYLAQPCIDWIIDPTKGNSDYEWTTGHTVKRIRFSKGSHGVRYRGVNMGAVFFQTWGVLYEQCGFDICGRGFRMAVADIDSTAPSQNFYGSIRNCEFRSCNSGEAFYFDLSTSQLELGNVLCEGCGNPASGYAIRISTYGLGRVWIHDIEFGDGSQSPKDAYIFTGSEGCVDHLRFGHVSASRDVDIGGRGYFKIGRSSNKLGNINVG